MHLKLVKFEKIHIHIPFEYHHQVSPTIKLYILSNIILQIVILPSVSDLLHLGIFYLHDEPSLPYPEALGLEMHIPPSKRNRT